MLAITIIYTPHRIMSSNLIPLELGEIREVFNPHRVETTMYTSYTNETGPLVYCPENTVGNFYNY